MKHTKPLSQERIVKIFFANLKGNLVNLLVALNKSEPQKSATQIQHERETLKRRQIAERPPMKTKPNPVQKPKRY